MVDMTFRPEMVTKFSISREAIEKADNFGEIFDIADNLGVDLKELNEIDEMKTRLLLYHQKCEGGRNYKDVVGDSMVVIQTEDSKKREKLIKLLSETRDKLAPFTVDEKGETVPKCGSAVIKGFLKSEGIIQNLDIEIENKLEALKRGDCTVVVSDMERRYLHVLAVVAIQLAVVLRVASDDTKYSYWRGNGQIPNKTPCPDRLRDDGASCWNDAHIYRKGCCCTIFGCCHKCDDGYHDDGCTCRKTGVGIKITLSDRQYCDADWENYLGLCYPKCKDGYHRFGCCFCVPN